MKILGQLSPVAAPLAMALSLLLAAGNLRAFGPGGTGTTGGTNGTATGGSVSSGVSTGGSSHGSVSTAGSSRVTSVSPAAIGARSGVSFSNNAPRVSTNAYTQASVSRAGAPAAYAQGLPAGQRNSNAWSGTAVNPAGNTAARSSINSLYRSNGYTSNRFAGQTSSSAWYDRRSGTNDYNRNGDHQGRYRFPYRYRNYPYGYGPYYAPYIGYYGGIDGAYPYYAGGTNGDLADGYNTGTPTVTSQYTDQGQDANADQQNPASQAAPRNQNAGDTAQSTVPNNGPDSLVEAVQQELIRRGYFGGKVDAMYGPDTKESLRKFQQDHHLADSGLINEATLHALDLD